MRGIALALVSDVIDTLFKLRRQEVITSDEVMEFLRRARPDVTEAELRKALMILELNEKIYVRKIKKENKEYYQIIKRK